jgi:tetratricopeptide (TPR) repeat protein
MLIPAWRFYHKSFYKSSNLKTSVLHRFFIFIFLMLVSYLSPGQPKKDEKANTGKSVGDTASVNHLLLLARGTLNKGQLDETMVYTKRAKALAKKIGFQEGLAKCYNFEGRVLYRKGKYEQSMDCLKTALMIAQHINDSVIISTSLNNLGNAYAYQGDHVKALEYYMKGLAIEEKIKIQNNLHWYYSNMGNIYNEQKNYSKALEFSRKAVQVEEKIKDKHALSVTLSNIGGIYSSIEKNDSALFYYIRSLKMSEEIKDTFSIGLSLSNSAMMYSKLKRYGSAYEYASKGYKIAKGKGLKDITVYCLKTLGDVNMALKKYDDAENYYLEAENIATEIHAKLLISDGYLSLSNLYNNKQDLKKAYAYYKLYSETKDTLLNEGNSKLITEMNAKYTTEKKEKEIELLKKNEDIQTLELAKKKNELERQQTVSISVFVGFILLMIVAVLMYSRFRLKKKANEQLQSAFNQIEEKNTQIEKSNLMITDSITYAKRIQDAILPAPEDLSKSLSNDFFILYKPSQIVSGDFYWCSTQGNKTIFVVADCTGHGVPGAFMSMIGNTLLNEIVNERKVTCTKKIAELLDEKIIHSLHQHEGTDKYDGMDISICCIDKITREINFTGAHHSMYAYNGHLEKIKGDPYSIGGAQQQRTKIFTSQQVMYEEGLRLYFLTDGYCDQAGGETHKRFSSKKFEALLEQLKDTDMNAQKEKLEQAFESWKGKVKQRDDVLVVGIKC